MAGRCFSCSHIGLGGPRIMKTTGQMGVATGYAAALCVKHNATPREVYRKHIDQLQNMIGYSRDVERLTGGDTEIHHVKEIETESVTRCGGEYEVVNMPDVFTGLDAVSIPRGNSSKEAPEFEFKVNEAVTVYLLVHDRGQYTPPEKWKKTDMVVEWRPNGTKHTDTVYKRQFPAGEIVIPGHKGKSGGYYAVPNMAVLKTEDTAQDDLTVTAE